MSDRLAKPSCLIVASAATAGVSAQSFLHCFTLASSAFNLQVATPGGKPIDFVDVNEGNTRWIQDFRMKSYASPAKLESIDGARYHALLIPNCPGAVTDLANSGYLAKILQHFSTESTSIPDAVHVVLDRHLVTGQNENSTLPAVQNLLILCNVSQGLEKNCSKTVGKEDQMNVENTKLLNVIQVFASAKIN
ncbi:hypothetical protein DUI87_25509 [Hirundo rustica rustica]|uniref:Glutamine amidotransferase-like class 1 domain-containing protein 1 n=1 Tax=Hirundo rustica rustica TaxID=333673 RepID=A0A3M0JA40_HIRRU|nr:hypothetical protein DUI87_25509 [Hirundo rustica rustica]